MTRNGSIFIRTGSATASGDRDRGTVYLPGRQALTMVTADTRSSLYETV
jgi:hypothetical protein